MTTGFKGYRVVLGVALLLASFSMFLCAVLFTRLATTTQRTNDALCTFRTDVRRRADTTQSFLAKHPKGIPGVPVLTLRQSLDAQLRTVESLADLECPPPAPLSARR